MIRISGAALALALASISMAQAADPQVGASVQPAAAQQVDFEAAAEKACSAALDNGRFDYNTMEECVSDTTIKLQRQAALHASASPDPKASRPN